MISKAAIPDFHALLVRELREPFFDPHWHFHPEYQLFVVLEGTGTRFIGGHAQRFGPGDLVLTGPNLPHVWRSDEAYFDRSSGLTTHGIVVYFREVILGERLLATQEALRLRQLLDRSRYGLAFSGPARDRVEEMLRELLRADGFGQVVGLLQILHRLSLADEAALLSRYGLPAELKPVDRERMERVYAYVMGHFTGPVRLSDVAAVANMTPTSFCRYFRERANRTLSDFIAELRIGYACKLIAEADRSVSEIAYECGYRTLSNFNRQFRTHVGMTPRQYKQTYATLDAGALEDGAG